MKFPRPVKKLKNGCVAVVRVNGKSKGKLHNDNSKRPIYKYQGESWKSSRLSYHLNVENITRTPCGFLILHKCDNGWCVNPDHLYIGSHKDNTRDMYTRNKVVRLNMSKSQSETWNEDRRRRMSEILKGNTRAKGKNWSHKDETKEKIKNSWNEVRREKQSEICAERNRKYASSDIRHRNRRIT